MMLMSRLIVIATLVWLLVSIYLMLKPEIEKYRRRRHSPDRGASMFNGEWKRLVLLCQGDEARARRLMEHERKENPGLSDREACERAIARYYRDNR